MVKRKRKKGVKRKSSASQRYFYAYSDRAIVNKLMEPAIILQTIISEPFFGKIPLSTELAVLEFKQPAQDIAGKYGAIVIPKNYIYSFIERGLEYKTRGVSPRELDSSETGLVFLRDFNLSNKFLGGVSEDLAWIFEGSTIIPYRNHASSANVSNLLEEVGYEKIFGFRYGQDRDTGTNVCGIPQNPHIYIHRLPGTDSGKLVELIETMKTIDFDTG